MNRQVPSGRRWRRGQTAVIMLFAMPTLFGARIIRSLIRVREWQKGQTMTEYSMMVASVAVAVLSAYLVMGTYLKNLLSGIDNGLL